MTRAAVLSWDWREQPDLDRLDRLVHDLSGNGQIRIHTVDTGTDQFAIVITDGDLDQADVQTVWRRWMDAGRYAREPFPVDQAKPGGHQ